MYSLETNKNVNVTEIVIFNNITGKSVALYYIYHNKDDNEWKTAIHGGIKITVRPRYGYVSVNSSTKHFLENPLTVTFAAQDLYYPTH